MTAPSRRSFLKGLPAAIGRRVVPYSLIVGCFWLWSVWETVPARVQAQVQTVTGHAHFSQAEQEGARHAFAATRSSSDAYVVANPKCAALISRAERDTGAVAFALVGGYPELPRNSDGTPVTRADQLKKASFHRDRALLGTLPDALACVWGHPGRPEWVEAERQLRLAIHHLDAVDPTLPYLNPRPHALLPGQTHYTVVPPHGQYDDAIAQLHWTRHYALDLAQMGINAYLADPRYLSKRPYLRRAQGTYRQLQGWTVDAALKTSFLAPLDDPATAAKEGAPDRFCQVLDVLETLTDALDSPKPGMPEQWFALMLDLRKVVTDDPVELLMWQSVGDTWRRGNAAAWGGLIFANPAQRTRCGLAPLEER